MRLIRADQAEECVNNPVQKIFSKKRRIFGLVVQYGRPICTRSCDYASLVTDSGVAHCSLLLDSLGSNERAEIPGSPVSLASRLPAYAGSAGNAEGTDETPPDQHYASQVSGDRLPPAWAET